MTDRKALTLLGADYEQTLGFGGNYGGIDLSYRISTTGEMFSKALKNEPFEFLEFSLSNYTMMRARGVTNLTALPVFPYRAFRQRIIFVRKDSPLKKPSDLRGKKVGVPNYSMTAAVWTRGILDQVYGVNWREIKWVSALAQRFPCPSEVDLTLTDANLEQLLADGDLDALLTPELTPGAERALDLRSIFEDPLAEEKQYFMQTGIFPPNHVVIANTNVVHDFDDLAEPIFQAYVEAKKKAYNRRLGSTLLPWGDASWTEMTEVFGANPMPYGLDNINTKCVDTLLEFLMEQKLIPLNLSSNDLFRPSVTGLSELGLL